MEISSFVSQDLAHKCPEKSYQEKRSEFLQETVHKAKYSGLAFSADECQANSIYQAKIASKFQTDFEDDFFYDSAMKYKKEIENHTLFGDIYSMPKGVIHHHHMTSSLDVDQLKDFILGNPHIYQRQFTHLPTKYPSRLIYTIEPKEDDVPFQKIFDTWREANPSKDAKDYFLENLSMLPNELAKTKNNNDCWACFMPKYFFALHVMQYEEYYRKHLINLFQQCVDEKIYRLETRLTPGRMTDERMNIIPIEREMQIYSDCLQQIREKTPNFSFGIIVEMIRIWKVQDIEKTIKLAFDLKKRYPDLIIGMDLDGNEDVFPKFEALSSVMLQAEDLKKEYNVELPWILHCGESLDVNNQNLIDGHLLNSKRLGHGINLFKHSYLMDILKEKKVCIEINPISHQILKNVRDLRMHPAIGYLNLGLKVSISNDDPTVYNTKGVSYDFFVAMAGCQFNLLDIKVVILNSIECSEASEKEKAIYHEKFEQEWKLFIETFINKYI